MPVPTLFIGIGGTGTRMLVEIHRELGDLRGKPIGLLCIDARNAPEVTVADDLFHPAPAAIDFVKTWNAEWENIREWAPDCMRPKGDIHFANGCGMTRGFGRFFAVYQAGFLFDRISKGIEHVISNTPRTTPVDALDVFLLGSLTNGTGAGLLIDVAAFVRHVAATTHSLANLRVIGVHLDASAIDGAHPGLAIHTDSRRRAANSLAAVLELDSWFRDTDPARRYGVRVRGDRGAWHEVGLAEGRMPLDYQFLIQGTDRSGHRRNRESATRAAGHALALWAKGVDPGERKLDAFVATTEPNCFGSLGASILRVPDGAIADWVELVALEEALAWSIGFETASHLALLPAADETYRVMAPSLPDAVRHFMKEVLRIEERPGLKVNQVFDRFAADRERLFAEVERIHEALDREEDARRVPGILDELDDFIDQLEGIPAAWKARAVEVAQTEVIPRIAAHSRALVERGAVGLAQAFLAQLLVEVEFAWSDVLACEGALAKETEGARDEAFASAREEVNRKVEHWLSWIDVWFRRAVRANLESVKDLSVQELEHWFWAAGVQAASEVFGAVKAELQKRVEVLSTLQTRLLGGQALVQTQAEREAEGKQLQAPDDGGLVRRGNDPGFRDFLLKGLRAADRLDAAANAARGGRALTQALDELTRAQSHRLEWTDRTSAARLLVDADLLRKAVREAISKEVRPAVVAECSLGKVLRTSAKLAMEDWTRSVRLSNDAGTQDAGRARLAAAFSGAVGREVEALAWVSDPSGAMDQAVDLLARFPISLAVAAAVPMWVSPDPEPHRLVFVAVHPDNKAAADQHAQKALGRVMWDADRGLPRTEALVLQLELGASVEHLHIPDGFDVAYRAMLGHLHHHPHTDRRYGTTWPLAGRWDVGGERRAAALLRCAVALGLVKKSSTGKFSALADVSAGPGRPVFAAGTQLPTPRGHIEAIGYLSSGRGKDLKDALAAGVRARAQEKVHSLGGAAPFAAWVDTLVADASREGSGTTDAGLREAWRHTAEGLAELARDVRDRGALPEWLK